MHVPSRMRFLQRHLEWTAQATFRYDENARDISVRYGGPSGALVSVYLSPLGGVVQGALQSSLLLVACRLLLLGELASGGVDPANVSEELK
ncbi:MAG: hypothetical protein JNL21_26745 [Myxococcales bacterium]|nr:hypothetical protein [Myxococcales bacterium]